MVHKTTQARNHKILHVKRCKYIVAFGTIFVNDAQAPHTVKLHFPKNNHSALSHYQKTPLTTYPNTPNL